jgi:methionine sulfoxide reductase heme-binding subunit
MPIMVKRRWPLALGIVLASAAVWLGLQLGADRSEGWQLAARWTARVGFPVFLITYSASSLAKLWPSPLTRSLWQNRRWWGLGFAASHTIHLIALVIYLNIGPETRSLTSLGPGSLTYMIIFAMALSSNDASMRALGKNWKRLHTLGIHAIWLTFMVAYAGRIFEPGKQAEGVIAAALGLAALGLRIAARRKRAAAA